MANVSPARSAAFDILLRVEREDSYASELLHSKQASHLSAADHGLATELVMGVLRWRSVLDDAITRASAKPLPKLDQEVLASLRLAAYQVAFLDRIPDRAAIHESVELVKRARKTSAAAFVNAVLRKLAATPVSAKTDSDQSPRALAQRYAHPEWLVSRWLDTYGVRAAEQICYYDQQVPRPALRIGDPSIEERLQSEGILLAPGELLSTARRVLSGNITSTELFRQRRVSIQDEASQLIALLVHGDHILDCCAAPGGKTAVLAARHPSSSITTIELHPHRARLLRRLVSAQNVRIIAADARQLPFASDFDSVLVDAPCSGTGTLARNPEIKWRLRSDSLSDLRTLQLDILRSAATRTRRGGQLVYSVCSLEPEESVQVIEQFLKGNASFRVLDCRLQLDKLRSEGQLVWQEVDSLLDGPYLRTIPGRQPCDGFFAAVLMRV